MCKNCVHAIDPNSSAEYWKNWDGIIEIRHVWADEYGGVHHITESEPAPEGVETEWGVYGHDGVDGGVFWIADLPTKDAAQHLAHMLESQHKEIARMRECLEKPVGYVNQGVLVDLREKGKEVVLGVAISCTPNSHNNVAIYAEDEE